MKRITLLYLLLVSLFVHNALFAQNEILYHIDTNFTKKLRTYYDDLNDYECANLWIKRIEETIQKRKFYDFEVACRNLTPILSGKMDGDSLELYSNYLFNHLDNVKIPTEYRIILSYVISTKSLIDPKLGEESLTWRFKGKNRSLDRVLADSLNREIIQWRIYPVDELFKYHFPYKYEKQNFVHFFLEHYPIHITDSDQIEIFERLANYYKKVDSWEEYISCKSHIWKKKGIDSMQSWLSLCEEVEQNEYVTCFGLSKIMNELHGKKNLLMNINADDFNRITKILSSFKMRFPESVFTENIQKFEHFLTARHFSSNLLYHSYNTPTIVKVTSFNADTLFYYHFIKHDSRGELENFKGSQLQTKGIWLRDVKEGIFSTDLYAISATEAVQHFLIIAEKQLNEFNVFDTIDFKKLQFEFGVNIHSWNEVPYAIKRRQDNFVSYLVAQEWNTGKALPDLAIYNKNGAKIGETNKQGIASVKLRDSLHYMIHHSDTFLVDEERNHRYIYRDQLLYWDDLWSGIGSWFERFEWYSIADKRDDTKFSGFTDRTRYRPGDTVHYKVFAHLNDYRGDKIKLIPYFLSKTSVALYNPDNSIIARDTVTINAKHAVTGYFVIPKDAKLGSYKLGFNGFSYNTSGVSFDVEDYIDTKYLLKIGEVKTVYNYGDTVEFIAHIESRTGERIPGVKMLIEGDKVLTRDGLTNHKGEFVVRAIIGENYSNIKIKAYLSSGEVLSSYKGLSRSKNGYKIKKVRIDKFHSKWALYNNDDVAQRDTLITLLHYGRKKSSSYSELKGNVHFTKDEFIKWYPLSLAKGDSIIKREIVHSENLFVEEQVRQIQNVRFVIDKDTISLFSGRLYRDDYEVNEKLEVYSYQGKRGRFNAFLTPYGQFTYLKRRLNGHFYSKTLTIKEGQGNKFLTRQINKNKHFEIITQDGDLDVISIKGCKYDRSKKRIKNMLLEWDSLPSEIFPGQEYTVGLRVKKGKRYIKPELALYMAKEEHSRISPSYPYRGGKIIRSYKYLSVRYSSEWNWIKIRGIQRDLLDTKVYKFLDRFEMINSGKGGVARKNDLQHNFIMMEDVVISAYKRPLIQKDGGASGATLSREDIAKLPVRSGDGVPYSVAGVNSEVGFSVRGSRSDESYYYIDGVKVRGSSDLALSDLEEVTIATGGASASFGDEEGGVDNEDKMLSFDQIRERNRFGDTQFFIPQVKRKGKRYEVTFTQNDEITAWQLVAVAGTRNYHYAQGRQRLISVQPVQLIENTPRFVRVGDTVIIGGNIFNRTTDTLEFKPTLNIYQSVTKSNLNIDFGVQDHPIVKVAPNAVKAVEWKVNIPTYYLKTLDLEMAVAGKVHGDRFNKSIPVLQRKGIYEVGQTFVKVEEDTLQFVLNKETYLSETAEILDANFYVNGNKEIEYLITRGKALENPILITSTGLASNWALVAELHEMLTAKPVLKILLDREFKSVLDSIEINKNEALKVVNFSNRLFTIMQLQELADPKKYEDIAKKRSEELQKFLDEKGEYKWLQESEKGSIWTTRYVIRSLAKIKYLKFSVQEQLYDKWAKVIEGELKLYLENKDKARFWSWRLYYELDDYAVLRDTWSAELNEVWQCFVAEKWQDAGTTAQLYFANLALKMKDSTFAKQIAKSILSYTSYSKSKGRFIPKQSRGSELENQAELILLLEKLGGYNREIVQLQQYMQIHQDYNDWSRKSANVAYLRALICGPSQEHLLNKDATIIINQKRTNLELTKNHAIEVDVEQNTYDIKVISHPDLVVTGGFKVKFMDDMEKINRSTDDRLRMERFIYFKVGDNWKLATENSVIPIGSTIRMDIVFAASNEFSELVVELPRITGLEFANSRSGYRYGQVRYYAEMKNEVVKLYVDRIRDGKSTISLEGVVTNAGAFLFAPSSLTSERNPEIGVTDKSLKVKIEK